MKNGNIPAILAAAIIFIFFATVAASAQMVEEPPRMPGITEGTGRHFEVTDSLTQSRTVLD